MDHESERIRARIALYDLLLSQPDHSNRFYAQVLQHSEKWVRKWRARFQQHPPKALADFFSQSRAPKRRPRRVAPLVQDAIAELRETLSEQYYRPAGARLIAVELQQRQDLVAHRVPTSSRTITRILHQRGYIVPRQRRLREPLPLTPPMVEWEMDFCEVWVRGEGTYEFFLAVDRGTSRVIHLEGRLGYSAETALAAVLRMLTLYGLPKRLRFDRDSRFVASWTMDSYPAPLVRFLRVLGIEPVICPPRRPDKKPYVERCIKTLKYEWLARHDCTTHAQLREAADGFKDYYHRQRRHFGAACRGDTPDEAFPVLPLLPEVAAQVQPNRWLTNYDGRIYRRRVNSHGVIQIDKHTYYVGGEYAKQAVWVRLDAAQRQFHIYQERDLVKTVAMQGLHPEQASLSDYVRWMQEEARSIERARQLMWQQREEMV